MIKSKSELIKAFELIPKSKIKAFRFHEIEADFNQLYFKNIQLGVLLSFFFDQNYNQSFRNSVYFKIKELLIILIRSFTQSSKIIDYGRKVLYFNRGEHRHYMKMSKSFNFDKTLRNQTLIVGTHDSSDIGLIFNFFNFFDLLMVVKFILKSQKIFNQKLKPLKFSVNMKIKFNIYLLIQLLKSISVNKFINKQSKLILIGSDADRGYNSLVFFSASRSNNIRSFTLQHGVVNGYFGKFPLNADQVWVWGKMARRQFIEMGVDKKNILVTGTPIISKYTYTSGFRHNLQKKYNLNSGHSVCLALSNPSKKDDIRLVSIFKEIEEKFASDNDSFFVKIHPARDKSEYSWIEDEFDLKIIPQKISHQDFMCLTDILLTHSSGLATECLINDKKVGILDILDRSSGNGKMLNIFYGIPMINQANDYTKILMMKKFNKSKEIYFKTGNLASEEICSQVKKIIKI